MTSFIQNILWNSVEGFVEAGKRTAGGYAGDALIKAGDLIENSGRGLGNKLERRASGYGTTISGQGYQPSSSSKAAASTAVRKPAAVKRSNSSPAAAAATTKRTTPPTSKTPIGANKYPGGKAVTGAAAAAPKQLSSSVGRAKSLAGGSISSAPATPLPKPFPPTKAPYTTTASASANQAKSTALGAAKGAASSFPSKTNALPKPYPSTNAFPGSSSEKKTAVKLGQAKPFKAPEKEETKKEPVAPYPGTNTLPGEGKKTPVRPKKYKPLERIAAPAAPGKMQHISV